MVLIGPGGKMQVVHQDRQSLNDPLRGGRSHDHGRCPAEPLGHVRQVVRLRTRSLVVLGVIVQLVHVVVVIGAPLAQVCRSQARSSRGLETL